MEKERLSTLLVLLFITFSSSFTKISSKPIRVPLIHRDSPLSPHHEPNLSLYDRNRARFARSIARHAQASSTAADGGGFVLTPPLTPEMGEYFTRFWVGTPPVLVTTVFDTGSSLIWFQCQPCKHCFDQTNPIFDTSASETWSPVDCGSSTCDLFASKNTCDGANHCNFRQGFLDGSYTSGVVSMDRFVWDTHDGHDNISDIGLVFLCGNDNDNKVGVKSELAGGTGLARGPLSLTSQLLVKTFSYCLGFRGDQEEEGSPSFLQFGDDIPMKGNSTPMYRAQGRETQYTVSVDSITFGGDQIFDTQFQITGPWRRPGGGGGGPVIDSGTEMTIIDTRAFNFIYDAVRGAVKTGLKEVDDPMRQSELCYEATTDDFETVPNLRFHFRGGAELVLGPMKMFVPVRDDIVCLALLRSYSGLSIIGNVAQQNYMVGFDLDRELIYFEPNMC
ncbi:Aspartic proteinase CDR1 [Acorus calamus]|uniref:Aspartic proteinase CDR1 n=1 Tax=Acorus calamus TaxID=4465 RepID=A0AAV9DAS6_ACOCL|nr:Aspartic proteinase CDR1 [Acorus calamus]